MNRKTLVGVFAAALFATQAAAQAVPAAPQSATPDADKLESSAEQLARMKTSLKQVLARVDEARAEKDVVKLNCVNEKLAQIKSLLKVAEQADIALHEAVARHDEGAESEFAKIAIARSKIEGLRGESEQCIGQLAYIVDEKTTVEVQQPSNLPATAEEESGRRRRRFAKSDSVPFPVPPVVRPPPASRSN